MKAEVKAAGISLGVPLPDSENPFIAVPAVKMLVRVEMERGPCHQPRGDPLAEFSYNLARGLEIEECPAAEVKAPEGAPRGGVYAAATAVIVYTTAKWYGEKLDTLEIVELARLAEPFTVERSWTPVLDSLRYSALEGAPAVYRNEEEHSTLPGSEWRAVFSEATRPSARVSRDSVGSDPYNALVHLMGVAVLEAALRAKETGDAVKASQTMIAIHEGVALAAWGLPPRSPCTWSPGFPGEFELACPA